MTRPTQLKRIVSSVAIATVLAALLPLKVQAAITPQADGIIFKRSAVSGGLGDGVVNQNGSNQTLTLKVRQGHIAKFDYWIWNVGSGDTFIVQGCGDSKSFKVTYRDNTETDVTADVVGSGSTTPTLDGSPLNAVKFEVDIKVTSHAKDGAVRTCLVDGTPTGYASNNDVVGARVKVD